MQQRLPVSLWHDQCRWNRFQCPIPSRFLVAFCNPRIWCCVHTILQQRSAAPCLEYAIHMYLCDRMHLHIVFVLLYSVILSVSVSIWMVFGFPACSAARSARLFDCDRTSRLETGNNRRATVRGSWIVFLFRWYWQWQKTVGAASCFSSCCSPTSWSDVGNKMASKRKIWNKTDC